MFFFVLASHAKGLKFPLGSSLTGLAEAALVGGKKHGTNKNLSDEFRSEFVVVCFHKKTYFFRIFFLSSQRGFKKIIILLKN